MSEISKISSKMQPYSPRFDRKTLNEFEATKRSHPQRGISTRLHQFKEKRERRKKRRGQADFGYKDREKPRDRVLDRVLQYESGDSQNTSRCTSTENLSVRWFSNDSLTDSLRSKSMESLCRRNFENSDNRCVRHSSNVSSSLEEEFTRPEVQALLRKYNPDSYEDRFQQLAVFENDSTVANIKNGEEVESEDYVNVDSQRANYRNRVEEHYKRLTSQEEQFSENCDESVTDQSEISSSYKPGIDNTVWKAVDHERRLSIDKTNSFSNASEQSGYQSRNEAVNSPRVNLLSNQRSYSKSTGNLTDQNWNRAEKKYTSVSNFKSANNCQPFSNLTDSNNMRDITNRNKCDMMKAPSVSNPADRITRPISTVVSNGRVNRQVNSGYCHSGTDIIRPANRCPNISIDSIDSIGNVDCDLNSHSYDKNGKSSVLSRRQLNLSDDSLEHPDMTRGLNSQRDCNLSDDSLERAPWNPNVLGVDLYQSRVNMVKKGGVSTLSECSERSTMSRLDPQTYQTYAAGIVHSTRKAPHFVKMQQRFGTLERISQIEKDLQHRPATGGAISSLPRTLKSIKMVKANKGSEKMPLQPEEEELCDLYDDLDGAQKRNEFVYRTTKAGSEWNLQSDHSLMKRSKSIGDIKKVYDEGGAQNENTRVVKPDYQEKPGFKRDLSFLKLREKYKQLDEVTRQNHSFLDFVEAQKKLAVAEEAATKSGSYIQIMEHAEKSAKVRPLFRTGDDEKTNPYEVYVTNLKKSKSVPDMDSNLHVRSVSAPHKTKNVDELDHPRLNLSNSYRGSEFDKETNLKGNTVQDGKKFWQDQTERNMPIKVVAPLSKLDASVSTYQLQREPSVSPPWKNDRPFKSSENIPKLQPVHVARRIVPGNSGNLSNMMPVINVPEYRDRPDGHSSPIPPPLRTSSPFIDDASHPPPLPLSSPPSSDIVPISENVRYHNIRKSNLPNKNGTDGHHRTKMDPSNLQGKVSPIISSGSSTPPALFQMVLGRKWEPSHSDSSEDKKNPICERKLREYSPVYALPWERYKNSENLPENDRETSFKINERKSPIYSKPSKPLESPAIPPRNLSNDRTNESSTSSSLTPSFEVKDLRKLAENNEFAQTKFSLARGGYHNNKANLDGPYKPYSPVNNHRDETPNDIQPSSSFGSNDTFIFKDDVEVSNNRDFLNHAVSEDNLNNMTDSTENIWKTKSEPNIAFQANADNELDNSDEVSDWPANNVLQLRERFETNPQQYVLRNSKSSPAIVRSAELTKIKSVYENETQNTNDRSAPSNKPLGMPRTVSGDLAEIRKRFENTDTFVSRTSKSMKPSVSIGSFPAFDRETGIHNDDNVEMHAPVKSRVKAYHGQDFVYQTNGPSYDQVDATKNINHQTAQSTPPVRKHHLSTSDIPSEIRSPPTTLDRHRRDEEDARRREILRQVTEAERQRKAEDEALQNEARRHSDYFMPKQKSPIRLDRFDDHMIAPPTFDRKQRMPETRGKGKALYTFKAQGPKELSFRRDDVIYLLRQIDKNWWEAERHGRRGIVPINYIEILRSLDEARETAFRAEGQAKLKYKFTKQSAMELSAQKGDVVTLLRRVDDNWFEARLDGQTGIIPSSYIEVIRDPEMPLLTPAPSIAPSYASSIAPSTATTPGPGTPLRPSSPLWPDDPRSSPNFNSLPNHFTFPEPVSPAKYHADSRSPRMSDRSPTRRDPSGYYIQEQRSPSRSSQPKHREYNTLPHSASQTKDFSPHRMPQQHDTSPYHQGSINRTDYSSDHVTSNSRIEQYSPKRRQDYNQYKSDPYNNYSSLQRSGHNQQNFYGADRRQNDFSSMERQRSQSEINGIASQGSRQPSSSSPVPRVTGHEKWFDEASYRRQERRPEPERFYEQKVAPPPQPKREKPIQLYKVKYKYKPRNNDEIELREGDHVHIMEKCDDGWFVGSNTRTGQIGTFPGNYVEPRRD